MRYFIGIDLGGTNIAAGVVDENLNILKKGSVPTLASRPADEIVADMAKLCLDLIADAGLSVSDIEYAGIAAPGTANSDTGIIEYANNLPFRNFPIAAKLSEMSGISRVIIENDANAAALAEAVAGAAKGERFSVMITLGTGVGGGIIIDGKVYSGFNHAGAELGHMVISHGGRHCSCGRDGCWEAYSSATGLINMTKEKIEECKKSGRETIMLQMVEGSKVSGKTAFAAMKQGDAAASEVVDEYISYLACGISNIINIFQPNVLSIGGGICGEGDNLLIPLNKAVWGEVYNSENAERRTQIRIAQLGNDAGIIGAAALGL